MKRFVFTTCSLLTAALIGTTAYAYCFNLSAPWLNVAKTADPHVFQVSSLDWDSQNYHVIEVTPYAGSLTSKRYYAWSGNYWHNQWFGSGKWKIAAVNLDQCG